MNVKKLIDDTARLEEEIAAHDAECLSAGTAPKSVNAPLVGTGDIVGPDWHDICAAYEEAAEHLDICAGQAESERNAHRIVATRIRAAGNRVRPNVHEPRG